jgi:hypothetical protein
MKIAKGLIVNNISASDAGAQHSDASVIALTGSLTFSKHNIISGSNDTIIDKLDEDVYFFVNGVSNEVLESNSDNGEYIPEFYPGNPGWGEVVGNGSSSNPYQIVSAAQLNHIGTSSSLWGNAGSTSSNTLVYVFYKIMYDINLSGIENFNMIGSGGQFVGNINGNNKRIYNLTIDQPELDNVGMITFSRANVIYDLHLVNVDITGRDRVGGIAGWSYFKQGTSASVERGPRYYRCSVTGNINGRTIVGGITGRFEGRRSDNDTVRAVIQSCFTDCSIEGESYVGGIVGYATYALSNQSGRIWYNYALGNTTGTDRVGGVIGEYNRNSGTQLYSFGTISGSTNVGPVRGAGNTPSNSYYNSSRDTSTHTNTVGVGLTTAQMTDADNQETIFSGLSFGAIWKSVGFGPPRLGWEEVFFNSSDLSNSKSLFKGDMEFGGYMYVNERGYINDNAIFNNQLISSGTFIIKPNSNQCSRIYFGESNSNFNGVLGNFQFNVILSSSFGNDIILESNNNIFTSGTMLLTKYPEYDMELIPKIYVDDVNSELFEIAYYTDENEKELFVIGGGNTLKFLSEDNQIITNLSGSFITISLENHVQINGSFNVVNNLSLVNESILCSLDVDNNNLFINVGHNSVSNSNVIINNNNGNTLIKNNDDLFVTVKSDSNKVIPNVDSEVDLGSENNRFANIFTGDLHLRNERGHWQIVEESNDLTVINRITNKRYKFKLKKMGLIND